MSALCELLGFHFSPSIAFFMPVEKMLAAANGQVSAADLPIVENLLVPLQDQMQAGRAGRRPTETCDLAERRLDVDVDGAVKLCCASFERKHNVAVSLLDLDFDTIQQRRGQGSPLRSVHGQRDPSHLHTQRLWRFGEAQATVTLVPLGREMQRATAASTSGNELLETLRLNQMLENRKCWATGGSLGNAAWPAWGNRRKIQACGSSLAEAIETSVRRGPVRRGRNIPWDPVRLLFADAVFLRNLQHKPSDSREVLAKVNRIMPYFERDMQATVRRLPKCGQLLICGDALPVG